MPSNTPLIDFTNLPGAGDRVDLNMDQGPPAPLNLEPFGPNPWAGGGASRTNTPATGTTKSFSGSAGIWGTVLLLAIILL